MASKTTHALSFKVLAECKTTKARVGKMKLPHSTVDTPVFMPVGTQGTLKGLAPEQLEELDCKIMLGNTYHLGHRPGPDLLEKAGGLHKFMNWNRALLTDSGGFQMVSLLKLAEITEQGVKFESPHDGSEMMLTPEKSIEIQNSIGADIIMQLDDVVHSTTTGPRVEEAMWRTIRWLDRCIAAHKRPHDQNIFPIVQGGLDTELRKKCAAELRKRDVPGYAIGGLSGGEEKKLFWRMVDVSTDCLPDDKPRYLMGVGFAVDLVVCVALGCDMFDCVYPTRTARFGNALIPSGKLNLKHKKFERDFEPIDDKCQCSTCRQYTRAYLHMIIDDPVACSFLTVHNVAYQLGLMRSIQQSILEGRFPEFIKDFFKKMFPDKAYPDWAVEALKKVNVDLIAENVHQIVHQNTQKDLQSVADISSRDKLEVNVLQKNGNDVVEEMNIGDSNDISSNSTCNRINPIGDSSYDEQTKIESADYSNTLKSETSLEMDDLGGGGTDLEHTKETLPRTDFENVVK